MFSATLITGSKDLFSRIAIPLSIVAAGCIALIGVFIDYYPNVNDFLGNYYLSTVMNFSDIRSLYDGFNPVGYTLLLKVLVGKGVPAIAAYYVNVILSLLLMIVMAWHLKKENRGFLFPMWLIFFILFPRTFHYQITPGPDAAAMALFTIGVLLQLGRYHVPPSLDQKAQSRPAPLLMSIAGGISMGIGALFRYHVLVASILFLAAIFVVMARERKLTAMCGMSLIVTYAPQVIVNLATGHGPLETSFALNLYNLVYGLNWAHIGELLPLPSAKTIIFDAPLLFITHYLKGAAELGIFAIPPIAYGVLAPPERKKTGYACAAFCILYALFFGISASSRAVLLLIPLSLLFFIKVLFIAALPFRIRRIAIILTLLCGCLFLAKDAHKVLFFKEQRDIYRKMEAFFIANGVKKAQEVYGTDCSIYLSKLYPYIPLMNGGWARLGSYRYSDFFPELNIGSIDSFYADCARRRVSYVVLNSDASLVVDFCYDLFIGKIVDRRFTPVLAIGEDKVFRVAQPMWFREPQPPGLWRSETAVEK
jgi:hypothetical protein